MKPLPSKQVLDSLLEYDPNSGSLTWKPRGDVSFDTKHAGKPALISIAQGYKRGSINKQLYAAHRVIWKMMTGNDPSGIDHVDGNPLNNRWNNLREADQSINQKNQKKSSNNTSGQTGVYWSNTFKKWVANIGVDNKQKLLGYFKTYEAAVNARLKAEQDHGYHPNHGKR